jgi:hypothetical protein
VSPNTWESSAMVAKVRKIATEEAWSIPEVAAEL